MSFLSPSAIAAIEAMTPAQLAQTPVAPPPPGVTPNFANPATRYTDYYGANITFFVIATTFFLIRVYMKIFKLKQCRPEDITLLLGYGCAVTYFVSVIVGFNYGAIGKHLYELHLDQYLSSGNYFWSTVLNTLVLPALGLIKITIFLQYWHLFSSIKWVRYCILFGMFVLCGFYIPCSIANWVFESPWNGESHVSNQLSWHFNQATIFIIPSGYIGMFLDWYMFFLPMRPVWQLNLKRLTKIGVLLIFATGGLACIASTVGLVYRINAASYQDVNRIQQGQVQDVTWDSMPILLWLQIEMFCGIIAACMPFVHLWWKGHSSLVWFSSKVKSGISRMLVSTRIISSHHDPAPRRHPAEMKKGLVEPPPMVQKKSNDSSSSEDITLPVELPSTQTTHGRSLPLEHAPDMPDHLPIMKQPQ